MLRMDLDKVPLWRGDHVPIKMLVEDYAKYIYLPRMTSSDVLIGAIRDGLGLLLWGQESFAYADSFDEAAGRYLGLRGGQLINNLDENSSGLIVKPDVAQRQIEAESLKQAAGAGQSGVKPGESSDTNGDKSLPDVDGSKKVDKKSAPKRYHGIVELDPSRVGRDAGRIADEVISHLVGLMGSNVRVTLEIEADLPSGVSEHLVRTVTENGLALKFSNQGFETE